MRDSRILDEIDNMKKPHNSKTSSVLWLKVL